MKTKRRSRGSRLNERGASLVLALGVMLAIGGIVGGLVTFLDASFRVSTGMQNTRNRQYAADAGIEQAIRMVQTDSTNRALLGAYCQTPGDPLFVPAGPINGYNVTVQCQGAPTAVLDSLNRTVIERNVIFLACVAAAPAAAPSTCPESSATIRAKVNFPTDAAGVVRGAFVQSWSVI